VYVNGEGAQLFCSLEIPCEGPSALAAATLQPVVNGDPAADAEAGGNTAGLRSALALPLESDGASIGVLVLYHAAPNAFSGQDLRILLAVRERLAWAVKHAFHEERAEQLAAMDPLTGLPNRRALFHRLDAELARCRRNRTTLALVVCEIDGLSRVQRQSAAAGQRLCKAIASGLRRSCREDDCVARMDEGFVLALGGFTARDLPEKRHLIESLLTESAPSDSLALRLGAAYYPDDGAYAEDLLSWADLRMQRPIGMERQADSQSAAGCQPAPQA
jgi:diguanylate cyclase (GGDEF)-like protein